jgi:hypothetical protein
MWARETTQKQHGRPSSGRQQACFFFFPSYLQEVGPTRQINRIDLQRGSKLG